MAAQKGRSFIVKIGDAASPEVFAQIEGQRSTGFAGVNEAVDISNKDTGAWRKLGADMGLRNATLTLSGIFTDLANEEVLRASWFAGSIVNYQVVGENGDDYTGPYQVTAFGKSGEYNNAEIYDFTLESADALTFTSA